MLGDSTDVNRANAETAEEVHVAWQEIPRLNRERGVLNTFYLEMFDAAEEVEFDYEDPKPASANDVLEGLQIKSAAAELLVGAGWDPDDVLQVVGLSKMGYKKPATPPAKPTGSPAETKPLNPAEHAPGQEPNQTAAPAKPPPRNQEGIDESLYADLGTMLREAFTKAKSNGHSQNHEEKV
jgi:hypothetical protein